MLQVPCHAMPSHRHFEGTETIKILPCHASRSWINAGSHFRSHLVMDVRCICVSVWLTTIETA